MQPPVSHLLRRSKPHLTSSMSTFIQALIIFMKIAFSHCHDHIVGGSIWSIPISNDFYINWSKNQSFFAGDNLVFRFETGLFDVIQVSRREFEGCTSENAFRSFEIGPATVSLIEEGVSYFICGFGNYCFLGQKVSVQVQRQPLTT